MHLRATYNNRYHQNREGGMEGGCVPVCVRACVSVCVCVCVCVGTAVPIIPGYFKWAIPIEDLSCQIWEYRTV